MRIPAVTLASVAAAILLWPASAFAKRRAPAPVPPVIWQGLEYRAPLDADDMGIVQAFDISTGHKVWETKVYHVWISPLFGEEDVQAVFISSMEVQDGKLLVRNESGRSYRLDLRTGRVERSWLFWLLPAGFALALALLLWIRRLGSNSTS